MRFRIVIALIALIFLILIGLGVWNAVTKVSFNDRICDNQKFTLAQVDWLNEQAQALIVGSQNRTADQTAFIIGQFQVRRDAIQKRLELLDEEYC